MQDVDGFLELGDVHHAVNAACLPDPNLLCPRTYLVERLPVRRRKPGLGSSSTGSRFLPGVFWECQQIVVGRPYPTDLFCIVHTTGMYKILYALVGASQGAQGRMVGVVNATAGNTTAHMRAAGFLPYPLTLPFALPIAEPEQAEARCHDRNRGRFRRAG